MAERPDVAIVLPNLNGGGAERVCLSLANAFVARGLRVEFVVLQEKGELLDELPDGVGLVSLNVTRLRSAIRPLARYFRERQPRSVLASLWALTAVAVWARLLSGVGSRLVLVEHSDPLARPEAATPLRRLRLSAAMRAAYPRADAVVAVSAGAADSIARLSRSKVTVIHNPIEPAPDEAALPAGVAEGWLAAAGPRLVTAGALKPAKNFPLLLRALAIVRQSVDARLLILGEGALRPELEGLAGELGVAEAVDMPGFVRSPHAFFRRADLFVMSSSWEGFGNVLVEAMSCGTPVVSTDCRSGPREILDGGRFGRLTPEEDEQALAQAILASLAEHPDTAALKRRAGDFSVAKAADAYLDLLGL